MIAMSCKLSRKVFASATDEKIIKDKYIAAGIKKRRFTAIPKNKERALPISAVGGAR
jgi:hypothetical protein